jgi:hypothetical protein
MRAGFSRLTRKRANMNKKHIVKLGLAGLLLALAATGCKRGHEEDFNDRTLEKRPHVETVRPENKADPFRP